MPLLAGQKLTAADLLDLIALLDGMRVESGEFDITFAAASSVAGTTVFDTPFASAPIVIPGVAAITANTVVGINITARSATQFSWRVHNVQSHANHTGTILGYYIAHGVAA